MRINDNVRVKVTGIIFEINVKDFLRVKVMLFALFIMLGYVQRWAS